jgi:catechol 2,3-dioxygenase-like lactoylglutathione lyase family enzyme
LQLPDDQLEAARNAMRHTVAGLIGRLDRFEGAHILVFASADAELTAERLDASGLAHTGARPAQRPIATADGTRLEAIKYLEIHAEDAAGPAAMLPEGRVGVAQDAPAAVLDAQIGLEHANGAVALAEVVLWVDGLEAAIDRYERYLGVRGESSGDAAVFDFGGSALTVTAPSAFADRFPGERAPAAPALCAYAVEVADLAATERFLRDRGVEVRTAAGGEPFVPGAAAHGAAILFRQA